MAELKTLQGILALLDIVNFTNQATKLGNKYTALYTEYFQHKVTEISEKNGFQVIKSVGDAVLFFGADVEGLLDIMLDVFQRDKLEDKYGFISRFRMVAHSGFFQFKIENKQLVDLVSSQGIIVFRLEKEAEKWELVVTPNLYDGVKSFLTQKNLEAHRMELREPFKGFDGKEWGNTVYKLRIVKGQERAANLLEPHLDQLKKNVQYIPVFGNIYPPVPMEKNFINLSLICDDDHFLKYLDYRLPPKEQDERKEKGSMFHEITGHDFNCHSRIDDIDVLFLYDNFRKGIIMGLPGAGKTTILRNIAYREFKQDETEGKEKKQVTLFVPCADVPLYNDWYKQYYGIEPTLDISTEDALDYMAWVFLLGKKNPSDCSPDQLVEFRESTKRVKLAFNENRVTLLIDALDETADMLTREKIKEVFITLYTHTSKNRLYLTSRPSEDIHLTQDILRHNIPLFRVLSLTMDQVRAVAKHLMDENSNIYKKFDTAIWQEEMVVKMAATPITVLLLTAYFQAYEKFDHRYPMYDLLMKFILLRTWENIKKGIFPHKNLGLFFQEIKSSNFFDKHKETEILYDALASLCFKLIYEDVDGIAQRSITEDVMDTYFMSFIRERMPYDYNEKESEIEASRWRERFHRDHLLVQAGAGKFVFVHSTFMEFLAAYYIVTNSKKNSSIFSKLIRQCFERQNFLELETIPIAAGSSLAIGYDILKDIGKLVNEASHKEHIYILGMKCLCELEWLLEKIFKFMRMKSMRKTINDLIEQNRNAVYWVYEYLRENLLTNDKDLLRKMVHHFQYVLKLSRNTFFEEYLDFNEFDKGDSELVNLRRQLLLRMVQKELVENWYEKNKKETFVYDNVLQLNTLGYHPDDKNFNYYKKLIGKELTGFFGCPNLRHSGPISAFAFSADGNFILSASEDNILKLWELRNYKEIRSFYGHTEKITCCAFSPDEKKILSSSLDFILKLWDVESGREIKSFPRHHWNILSSAFSPLGRILAYTSKPCYIILFDIENGRKIHEIEGHNGPITSFAFSPDGEWIVSASSDKVLKLWDVITGKEIRKFSGHEKSITNCTFSPDGNSILSASEDKTLKLWEKKSSREIRTFYGHNGSVKSCIFSPDGKNILSSSSDKTLKLWDVETGKEIRTFSGHQGDVNNCSFSPNGGRFVSGSCDNTLKVWDVETGKEMQTLNGHQGDVFRGAFSSDGKYLLSAGYDHTLKLWDVGSGKEIRTFTGHQESVYGCAFSPKGDQAVSSSGDHTLKLWDVKTGKEIRTFNGHEGSVISCAFSPDGEHIISGSLDKSLFLWDVFTGKQIRHFISHKSYVISCSFSPDGKFLLSGSWDNTMKLWNVERGKEIRTFVG
ncbi:MAG: NACHT domain-containing protein, partial [Acidobacteria bacterium]|nr:NACHT domain-containing protein [Acidobacteriota bacterium]